MDEKQDSIWDYVRAVLWALLLAIVFRSMVYEPFSIPSGSMQPTLLVGDHLFVSKWTYGYSRHSFTMSPPIFSGRVPNGAPDRGDVIVFKFIEERWRGGEKEVTRTDFIKRLIGLPGDTIQMKQGRLHINGAMVPRRPDGQFSVTERNQDRAQDVTYRQFIETLPNGVEHKILELADDNPLDNTQVFKVPEGHYFFMGDNRDNSNDSRLDVSYVPAENLVGRADVLFLSIDWQGGEWSDFDASLRWDRMFTTIGP